MIKGLADGDVWDELLQLGLRLDDAGAAGRDAAEIAVESPAQIRG